MADNGKWSTGRAPKTGASTRQGPTKEAKMMREAKRGSGDKSKKLDVDPLREVSYNIMYLVVNDSVLCERIYARRARSLSRALDS